MLIVGTRGRSLGGFQGLVANRNSFSKWCLQYSPIPVVVVRPTEKRTKKKKKRDADPDRQDYAKILRDSGVEEHETTLSSKSSKLEASKGPIEEAHAVAAALGIPLRFESALTTFDLESSRPLKEIMEDTPTISLTYEGGSSSEVSRPSSILIRQDSKDSEEQAESPLMSGEESSDEEDEEGEFEAVSGHALLNNDPEENQKKKDKLHEMEMLEAAALAGRRKGSFGSGDSGSSGGANIKGEDEE